MLPPVFLDELKTRRARMALLIAALLVLSPFGLAALATGSASAYEQCRSKIEPLTAGATVAGIERTEAFVKCEPTSEPVTPMDGATRTESSSTSGTPDTSGPTVDNQYEIYGDCTIAEGAESCVPPLEVVVSPACEGSLDAYVQASRDGLAPPYDPVQIRGVRGASIDGGRKLMLAVGRSTVLIFAETPQLAQQAVAALQIGALANTVTHNAEQALPSEASAGTIARDSACSN